MSGNNDGLNYDKIFDSIIFLPPVDDIEEEWDNIIGHHDAKW